MVDDAESRRVTVPTGPVGTTLEKCRADDMMADASRMAEMAWAKSCPPGMISLRCGTGSASSQRNLSGLKKPAGRALASDGLGSKLKK